MSLRKRRKFNIPILLTTGVLGGGGPFVFEDNFNRANGAIGGNWAATSGTWIVASNKAQPATVGGSPSRAIATQDFGYSDVLIRAKVVMNGTPVGFVVRYVDSDNYVMIYFSSTNQVTIRKRVGGTETTVAYNTSNTYSAGAVLEVRCFGDLVQAYYADTGVGIEAVISDAVFDNTSTTHGIFSTGVGSVLTIDDFYITHYTGTSQPELLYSSSTAYNIRVPVNGSNKQIKAVWSIGQLPTNAWFVTDLKIQNIATQSDVVVLDNAGMSSKYGYAFRLGQDSDIEADYTFVGGIHGNEALNGSLSVTVDATSVSLGNAATGSPNIARGDAVVFDEDIDIINESDTVTVGLTDLTFTFTSNGLLTEHDHTFTESGYSYFTFYGAMLPVLDTAMDTYRVAGFDTATIVNDDNVKQQGTQAAWVEFSDTGHPYKIRVTLTDGTPGQPGGWDGEGLQTYVLDRSDGITKAYLTYISGNFSDKQSVHNSTHSQRYTLSR